MIGKNRIRMLLFILMLLSAHKLIAQNNLYKAVPIASPNAASLGKYSDIPVNNHTGLPQISLPIYTVNEGSLSLPIGLSYHASGLKVMEQASWVGAGWSLNAGGVITRTIQGQPDERLTSPSFSEQYKGHLSDKGYNNYLWKNLNDGNTIYLKDINSGKADGEPDLFFFNFAGYSGKFYFGDDQVPVVLPEQDIKIEYDYTPGIFQSIKSYTLTTPDGNKYFFGTTTATDDTDPVERSLSISDPSGYANNGRSISSWYLYKIQSPDGLNTITLSYQPENYSYFNIGSGPLDEGDNLLNGSNLYKIVVEGVRLSKISFSNGSVDFITETTSRQDLSGTSWDVSDDVNTQAKALKEIKVSNLSGNCAKHSFTYDYFSDIVNSQALGAPLQSDKKRLKLLSVKQESCDLTVSNPPYTFEYYDELVPRKISYSQDHWGFYNGANNSTTMIPAYRKYTVDGIIDISGANRDSKWPEMRGGSLKKIIYPTGGTTEFEFESNTSWVSYPSYNKQSRLTFSMGYDGNNSPITQNYIFTNNPYRITLRNTAQGGAATVSWDCSSNPSMYAATGQTVILNNYFPAGPCNISISKTNTMVGYGAEVTIEEMVPYQVEKNEVIGGLRIKKITNTAGIGMNPNVTDYDYNLSYNGHSSGILYSKPTYVQVLKNSGARYIYQTLNYNSATWYLDAIQNDPTYNLYFYPYFTAGLRSALKSSSPILPMNTTQGNHIGYNEVKVSKSGNGYSTYRYYGSNSWDQDIRDVCTRVLDIRSTNPPAPEYPGAAESFDYKRGELKYENHVDQINRLLKEVTYYPVYQNSQVTTPAIKVYSINAGPPHYLIKSVITKYELYSAKKTEFTKIERTYDPVTGNYIVNNNTTLFESPYHAGVTKSTTINSKNEQLVSTIKYAFDYKPAGCEATNTCWSDYQTELSNNLSMYQSEYNQCTNDDCKAIAKSVYDSRNIQARSNYGSCRANRIASYNTCFQTAKQSANNDLKPILDLEDKFINAIIENAEFKGNYFSKSSFNKYDYGTSPSGFPYPSKLQTINLNDPHTTIFTQSAVNGSALTKDSRYTEEKSVKMDNGNIVEVKGKDGVYTSYLWGYNNTLPIVKATGVDYATLKAAYDAVASNLYALRNQASLSTAFINTYFYTPGVGIIQETDPRNRNINYEYDKLNRLILVRDHDGYVIKKICYNYAGQPEDCTVACINVTANWQNTSTALRCQQGTCGNTGYQEQEQQDVNPCSPTYNTIQWVSAGYNPTACPASCIDLTSTNTYNTTGYVASYYNTATTITYTFNVSTTTGLQPLGTIPAGNYNLTISNPGSNNGIYSIFKSGCKFQTITGYTAVFYNIAVSSSFSCKSITTTADLVP